MLRAASILMILLAVSAATFATGPTEQNGGTNASSDGVVLALGRPVDSLSTATLQNRRVEQFLWQPEDKERRWIYVVIHHSATESGSVEAIHKEHSKRKDSAGNFWLGIGYHFVIGNGSGMPDGEIESTFRWKQQIHGAHSGSTVHNANGIGICLIGNFQQDAPTEKQLSAVSKLIRQLTVRYKIPGSLVIGHNTVKPTACPGRNFPLQDVIRKSVSELRSAG